MSRVFDFLGIADLLQAEQCSDRFRQEVNQYFAKFGGDESTVDGYCTGCCQCRDAFDWTMHAMRFFLWIGNCTNHDYCWKGYVHSTSSSIILTAEIQNALVKKNQSFGHLYEICTNESRHERILLSKEGGQARPLPGLQRRWNNSPTSFRSAWLPHIRFKLLLWLPHRLQGTWKFIGMIHHTIHSTIKRVLHIGIPLLTQRRHTIKRNRTRVHVYTFGFCSAHPQSGTAFSHGNR